MFHTASICFLLFFLSYTLNSPLYFCLLPFFPTLINVLIKFLLLGNDVQVSSPVADDKHKGDSSQHEEAGMILNSSDEVTVVKSCSCYNSCDPFHLA